MLTFLVEFLRVVEVNEFPVLFLTLQQSLALLNVKVVLRETDQRAYQHRVVCL